MQPTQEPPAYTKSGQQTHEPKPNLNTEELQVSSSKQSWLNENYQIYINILNADVSFFSYSLRGDASMIIIYSPLCIVDLEWRIVSYIKLYPPI
jgi:hypothetical protein